MHLPRAVRLSSHTDTPSVRSSFGNLIRLLGPSSGNFSTVKLGINKETQERVAVKIIDKSLVKNKPEMLTNEVDILLRVKHPGIIGLLDLFDTTDKMMLCMELYVARLSTHSTHKAGNGTTNRSSKVSPTAFGFRFCGHWCGRTSLSARLLLS